MKKPIVAAALTAALIAGGSVAYASTAPYYTPALQVQDRVVFRGAVIRVGPTTYVYDNSAHASVGVTDIGLDRGCYLQVFLDSTPDERVVAAIVDEDESISELGIQAGVSGGNSVANIRFYKDGRRVCANDARFGSHSNIWLSLTYLGPAPATP